MHTMLGASRSARRVLWPARWVLFSPLGIEGMYMMRRRGRMIEQLVSRFFSDDWDSFAMQQGDQMIQENIFRARDCLPNQVFAKINDGWFHDAHIMQFRCNNADSLIVNIRKHNEVVDMCISSITSLEWHGAILDRAASFPYAGLNKLIAQILDIWVELSDYFTMIILLDNYRYLRIVCPPHQTIDFLPY